MIGLPKGAASPKVTIAIPTMNRVGYLRLALESALAQTYSNIEVVVSNNASQDDTVSYLESCSDPRLKVLHQQALLPMVQNWNACVAAAEGDYFLLLSDDDCLEVDAIQHLVAGYLGGDCSASGPGIVYCGGRIIDSCGEILRDFRHSPSLETPRELIPAFFRGERDLWFCGILFRTTDVLPGFSTAFQVSSDSALWITATIRHGGAVFIPRELVRYRVHSNTTSSTPLDIWQRELTQLCELAISELAQVGQLKPGFSEHLRMLTERLITTIIPGRINGAFGNRKLRGLREYVHYAPYFLNVFGLKILAKGVLSLLLDNRIKTQLRGLQKRLS